jgi:hypothetical protein
MYKTKPIDYEGCDPIIADHLRRGLAIECLVWYSERDAKEIDIVYGYISRSSHKYCTVRCVEYRNAEPIQYTESKTLKQPVELMRVLVDGGWSSDCYGVWVHKDKAKFYPGMWGICGMETRGVREKFDESWLDTTLKPVK